MSTFYVMIWSTKMILEYVGKRLNKNGSSNWATLSIIKSTCHNLKKPSTHLILDLLYSFTI